MRRASRRSTRFNEGLLNRCGGGVRILVLPDPDDSPASIAQQLVVVAITVDVTLKLGVPVLAVAAWAGSVSGASVPEAAVDEDGQSGAGEDDIGSDRPDAVFGSNRIVHPVAESSREKGGAKL